MKRLLWAVAILIIPPFAFWGAGSVLRPKDKGPSYAGKIFGKKISFDEYSASWQAAKNHALLIYGSKLDEISDALNLDGQAWERLILLHEAGKKRIRVPDREVVETVERFPFLQSNGQFDKKAYEMILAQVFRTSARQFEEEIRDSLAIAKLRDSVIKNITVTPQEVKNAYRTENEKSRISYILISPDPFKPKAVIDKNKIEKYYNNNSEAFRVPEQVNVEYLGFEFSDYKKDIQISNEEVKNYYNNHKEEFASGKDLKELADTIKNKLIQDAARQKALSDADRIDYILTDKAKNLEETAKENSVLIKETGFFARQGPIPHIGWFPEIQKKAFKLKVGERSELIKSNMDFINGYYIIRLKEKKPSYVPGLEEVKEKIETILKEESILRLAGKEADRLRRKILEITSTDNIGFEDAARKIRHKPRETESFARNGYIQGLGMAKEIGESSFTANPGEVSPVKRTRAGFCIFTVIEVVPADEKSFIKEKTEFTKKTLEAKKMKVLNEWYSSLIGKADLQNNIHAE